MNHDPSRDLRTEEEIERLRHDKKYNEERTQAAVILSPPDWQKFDTGQSSKHPYIASVQRLGNLAGKTALDVGCGTGWFSVIMAKRGAAHVDGFDISGEAIKDANANAEANGCSELCRFRQGSCYEIPFDDAGYDVVAGQAILHHVRNKQVAAQELHRVMRPGAKAVFYEPLGNSVLFERFRQRLPFASETDDPDHWKDKLTLEQLKPFEEIFEVSFQEFQLLHGLSNYVPFLSGPLVAADSLLLRVVSGLRRFARGVVIELTK